jgi:hypothetical protein
MSRSDHRASNRANCVNPSRARRGAGCILRLSKGQARGASGVSPQFSLLKGVEHTRPIGRRVRNPNGTEA